MDHHSFEQLVRQINSRYFAGGKRETINKSPGPFTAQQIYRLVGQFGGGADRTQVIQDLHNAKKILPMTSNDAKPIINMGIYVEQKRINLTLLVPYIMDRHIPHARDSLARIFSGADYSRATKTLEQAGPYQGCNPPTGYPSVGTSNVVVVNPQSSLGSLSYVAQNTGSMLFGGILTANVPTPRVAGRATAITHYGVPQPYIYPTAGVQNYPIYGVPTPQNYPLGALPPQNYPTGAPLPQNIPTGAYPPQNYPCPPAYSGPSHSGGLPSEPPPAYTPSYTPPLPAGQAYAPTSAAVQNQGYPPAPSHGYTVPSAPHAAAT